MTLDKFKKGDKLIIKYLECGQNFKKRLMELGLFNGGEIEIIKNDNFAPLIIKIAGVGAILAKSFGRIFYRNAINNGMLLIQCDTDNIQEHDILSIDTDKGEIKKEGDPNFKIDFKIEEIEKRILKEDGLLNYEEKHGSLEQL
jgi:Fe2+ transport system protein FeoA